MAELTGRTPTHLAEHLVRVGVAARIATAAVVSAPRRPGGQAQYMKQSMRLEGDSRMKRFLAWLAAKVPLFAVCLGPEWPGENPLTAP